MERSSVDVAELLGGGEHGLGLQQYQGDPLSSSGDSCKFDSFQGRLQRTAVNTAYNSYVQGTRYTSLFVSKHLRMTYIAVIIMVTKGIGGN